MTEIFEKELTEFELAEQQAFLVAEEQRVADERKLKLDRENALLKLKSIGLTESEVEALIRPL